MAFGRVNLAGDSGLALQGAAFGPLAAIATVVGTVVSAAGTIAAGQAASDEKKFEAAQYEQKAQQDRAAGQRSAMQQDKQTKLVLSRQQALAAGSGLGALDPTIMQLSGDTAAQGKLNSDMERYHGDAMAQSSLNEATAARASGRAALTGSYFGAAGTILSGAGSFYGKYGNGGYSGGGGSLGGGMPYPNASLP